MIHHACSSGSCSVHVYILRQIHDHGHCSHILCTDNYARHSPLVRHIGSGCNTYHSWTPPSMLLGPLSDKHLNVLKGIHVLQFTNISLNTLSFTYRTTVRYSFQGFVTKTVMLP